MSRRRRSLLALGALVVALVALVASNAFALSPTLVGSLVGHSVFPYRALAVWDSSPQPLAPGTLSVTENGHPISDLSVTPIASAGRGDFGVIAVVDESSSLTPAQRSIELEALHTLAGARTGNQQLGVITYDSTPHVVSSLTDNAQSLSRALATAPPTGSGEHVLPAVSEAIAQLKGTVDAGAVVVIGAGASARPSGSLTRASVAAAAHDAGIRGFTLGVPGAGKASRHALARLHSIAGGSYQTVPPAQLDKAVTTTWSGLIRGYVVRYRSLQPHGRNVIVTVKADGIPGVATAGYTSPAAPAAPKAAPKPAPAPTPAPRPHASAPRPFPMPVNTLTKHPPVALPTGAVVSNSFWHSSGSVLLVALLAAILLGLALALVLSPHSRRAVHSRVEGFIAGTPDADPAAGLGDEAPSGGLFGLLAKRPWWPKFLEQIEVGRIKHTPQQLLRFAAIGSLVAAVLGTMIFGTGLVAIPLLIVGPVGLRLGVRRAAKRQRAKFSEQLPAYLADLSGAMRVGRSLVGALAAVAESAEEPVRGELDRALADERLGLPLEQTLNAIGHRMESEDMEQVALIASLHRRSGSNVAEALDRVAEGSRERADMRRELSAMTGQARITSYVLTALPPILLFAIVVIDPRYAAPLLHTVPGIIVLVMSGLMVTFGWFVMKKITNVEV